MKSYDENFRHLLREEGLDDFEGVLVPREWDEVPFVSRFSRIDFLGNADAECKSSILVRQAVKHLDRLLSFIIDSHRNVFVMVSVVDWENLESSEPDPVIPCLWISTNPERDLVTFRVKPGVSRESE